MAWAVKFPQEMYTWDPNRAADQVRIDAVAAVLPQLPAAQNGRVYPSLDAEIGAIIDAIQAGQRAAIRVVEPLLTARHPSQIYEALLEGLLVFVVLAIVWARPRKPLVIGTTFGLVYALVRIFGEQFREPDADVGYQWLELTRGQWLSFPLLLLSLVLMAFALRRAAPRMGGWKRATPAPAAEPPATASFPGP